MTRAIIWAFDLWKKRRMNKLYQLPRVWGRTGAENEPFEIDQTFRLLAGHFHRALDLGTGLGWYAERMARIADEVVAIDISATAIERARKLHPENNIRFLVGNMRTYWDEAGFDLIAVADALYYLGDERFQTDFRKLVDRIAALLRRGGTLILVNRFSSTSRSYEQIRRYQRLFVESGLVIQADHTITHDSNSWLQIIFTKPA